MVTLALLLAALPAPSGRFVLEVAGAPVAELQVAVEGARFRYQSRRLLEEGEPLVTRVLALAPGTPEPEVLALLRRPRPGCRPVREELRGAEETLCVDEGTGPEVTGTLAGAPFRAAYDGQGRLARLDVGAAHWRAVAAAARRPERNPWAEGVAVEPTRARPPEAHSRRGEDVVWVRPAVGQWLAAAPRGVAEAEKVGRARCLVLARELAASRPGARLVTGLLVQGPLAVPHAWVEVEGEALDPSVLPGDPVLATRHYLALPPDGAGPALLELFDGARRVHRTAPP